jgi:hypothetical protein
MNAQIEPRWFEPEFVEENLRHAGIKMLAGVNQDFADAIAGRDRSRDWRGFDELRPGADDSQDVQIGHLTL